MIKKFSIVLILLITIGFNSCQPVKVNTSPKDYRCDNPYQSMA